MSKSKTIVQTSSKKWIVLLCFALAAAMNQMLWLNFAPILSTVEKLYGVSESQANLLILVFPLIYVFLSVPAGALTDRRGYRTSLTLGTVMMAAFACLRIYPGNFWILLTGQIGIAIAQPYIINSITKLVLDWFEKEHEAMAIGLGTMGMFIGMAAGMAVTPTMVESLGMQNTMIAFAVVSCAIALAVMVWVRPNPVNDASRAIEAAAAPVPFAKTFMALIRNHQLLFIFILSFLGLGYFNGVTTWLEGILAPHGINSEQAGIAGGVMILGGIVGAAIIPALSDKLKKRKPLLIFCLLISALTAYPFAEPSSYTMVLVLGAIQGFFILPAFSLLLEMCSEVAGSAHAAVATGILMLMGNAGGVIVILAMEWIKGDSPSFERSILMLLGLLVIGLGMAFRIKETYVLRQHS